MRFSQDVPQDLQIERLVGDEPLEAAIFIFERLQTPRIADLQIAVLLFPVIQRRPRDAVAADQLGRLAAAGVLLQNRDDLLGVNRVVCIRPPVDLKSTLCGPIV